MFEKTMAPELKALTNEVIRFGDLRWVVDNEDSIKGNKK